MITQQEYLNRIKMMQESLGAAGLDAVCIFANETEPANVRYFTGYRPVFETTAIIIPAVGEAILCVGPETERLVQQHSILKEYAKILEFRETSDPDYPDIELDSFESVFRRIGRAQALRSMGLIGTNLMTVQVYEGLIRALPEVTFSKQDMLLRKMRMIKSEAELDALRRAARIAGKGFRDALVRIRPGMTELEAAAECVYCAHRHGAEGTGFQVWTLSGDHTNQAIGIPTKKTIEPDTVFQVSMGVQVDGYVSSLGRAIVFGTCSKEIEHMFQVNLKANELTHQLITPGAKASEIATQVQELIRSEGLGSAIVYGPAHGIGMMECEYPFIESTSTFELEEHMTFAVDTFLAGQEFGMRFEDTVAVTSAGEEQYCSDLREMLVL